MQTELIDVMLTGGTVTIDLTNTIAQGYVDDAGVETTGEALIAVERAIKNGETLLDPNGHMILIRGNIQALTMRRVASPSTPVQS